MGFILQSKGDKELVFIARKKLNKGDQTFRSGANVNDYSSQGGASSAAAMFAMPMATTVVTTIREVTKKRLLKHEVKQYQDAAMFLSTVRHENLLQAWGLFWDEKKVYIIHEPAI